MWPRCYLAADDPERTNDNVVALEDGVLICRHPLDWSRTGSSLIPTSSRIGP